MGPGLGFGFGSVGLGLGGLPHCSSVAGLGRGLVVGLGLGLGDCGLEGDFRIQDLCFTLDLFGTEICLPISDEVPKFRKKEGR